MGDVSVLRTKQSNPKTAVFLCHSSTFGWINSQYYFVWYQTPAVVQHQKGRCLIHRAHGRCVCASYTATFRIFFKQQQSNAETAVFLCHSSTFGWINSQYYIVWYQTPAVVQDQKGRCLIHRAHGRCVCASYTTTFRFFFKQQSNAETAVFLCHSSTFVWPNSEYYIDAGRDCRTETKFSGANGGRERFIFPVHLTTSRISNLTRLIHTLAICDNHTHIHKLYVCIV